MGLLDDAIREHLDLKRRRGADPTEVERAEHEALGPVRTGPEPESLEAAAQGEVAYDVESEQGWEEPDADEAGGLEPAAEEGHYSPSEMFARAAPAVGDEPSLSDEPVFPEEPPRAEDPTPPRFTAAPDESDDLFAEDPLGDPFADDIHPGTPPPHPAPGSAAPRSDEPVGGETVEYRIDDALEAEPKKEGDDVLEKTPEFLQDTPDHDRLWFEQRPPKDFDFEG